MLIIIILNVTFVAVKTYLNLVKNSNPKKKSKPVNKFLFMSGIINIFSAPLQQEIYTRNLKGLISGL